MFFSPGSLYEEQTRRYLTETIGKLFSQER